MGLASVANRRATLGAAPTLLPSAMAGAPQNNTQCVHQRTGRPPASDTRGGTRNEVLLSIPRLPVDDDGAGSEHFQPGWQIGAPALSLIPRERSQPASQFVPGDQRPP